MPSLDNHKAPDICEAEVDLGPSCVRDIPPARLQKNLANGRTATDVRCSAAASMKGARLFQGAWERAAVIVGSRCRCKKIPLVTRLIRLLQDGYGHSPPISAVVSSLSMEARQAARGGKPAASDKQQRVRTKTAASVVARRRSERMQKIG